MLTLAVLISGLVSTQAIVGDVKRDEVMTAAEKAEGWKLTLTLGANASFTQSSNFVGVDDGTVVSIGLVADGSAAYFKDDHDWQNTLQIQHTQTKTAVVDRFVKSADALRLRSLYVYRFEKPPWLGPFAQLKLDTSLLHGYLVKPEDVTVVRLRQDGTTVTRPKLAQETISLTHPFEPLVLQESVGFYAQPLVSDRITADFKIGVGAQQIVVQDGFAVADAAGTPELELAQLESVNELGAVAEAAAKGALSEIVAWTVGASFFMPFVPAAEAGKPEGLDRLNTDIAAKLSVKLAKWASIDVVSTVKRVPLVVEEWQIQNGVIFTAGFNLL